jgi:hypothetical protein
MQNNFSVDDFFVFSSCDSKYFENYAKPLFNSIKANTTNQLHLHVINPKDEHLEFCEKNLSYSYEYVRDSDFSQAAERWQDAPPADSPDRFKYDRTLGSMAKSGDQNIIDRVKKTYYACIRFVRLAEILENNHHPCFSMDIDAVVRKQIPNMTIDLDIAIHRIEVRHRKNTISGNQPPAVKSSAKDRFLAGGIFLKNQSQSQEFLKKYSDLLKEHISRDEIYWSLDQEMLEIAMQDIPYTQLPSTLIDFDMTAGGTVWTAKGERKDVKVFQDELLKYSFS